jgi:AbrB family looped-hinge helix DNA binding protein
MPRITIKGQVTIPKEIRDKFGVKAGDLVEFVIEENRVYLIFRKGTILDAITKDSNLKPKGQK